VLGATNTADCWGSNASGELGNGTSTDASTPTPLSGGATVSAVTAGYDFSC